jgi:dihydropteroate synthase
MDYREAANTLFALRRYPSKPGTASTAALLEHLDDPHADLTCVQVAGSNGKGSTANMLASVLRAAGHSVGLYTSPHFDDVRERIRVDGRAIPEAAVADFVERAEDHLLDTAAADAPTTFFETLTAMALWYFDRRDVDVVVLEVGIGGRHDATSVVAPAASAVTNVALEHTDVLGDTIPEIARDKAAVAPADRPLVTAATGTARDTLRETAGDIVTVGDAADDVAVTYEGKTNAVEAAARIATPACTLDVSLPLFGPHQAVNAGVAVTLARQVASPDDEAVRTGLRRAHWPGRTELLARSPTVLVDGAHNPDACAALADVLAEFDYDDLHLVVGALTDKDHAGMAAALPTPDRVVACQPDHERAADKAVLTRVFDAPTVETRHAVADAVGDALAAAADDDLVLVTGSLHTVGEARARFLDTQIPARVETLDDARETLEAANVTPKGVWRMRGKGVHRVVSARVQLRQANYLKQELLSRGGECAVSGIQTDGERCDVVMSATLAQFKRLVDALDAQPYGLAQLAADLRDTLDIGTDATATGSQDDRWPWQSGTAVMGILNATPDSFHDGGEYDAVEDAVARAEAMVAAGADIVDVGGESTRPGADPVPVEREIDRVVPVIERIADSGATVSIDTRKAPVAAAALDAGADMVNDVSGLADPDLRLLVAERDVPVVVMHSIETPVDPDREVAYDDVVTDVIDDLSERLQRAAAAGIDRSQCIVDPGLGFGKTAAESFALLDRLDELRALDCPILVGHSHKSMFERVGYGADERTHATVGATALAATRGADIVRVHDVPENVAAVRAVEGATRPDAFE